VFGNNFELFRDRFTTSDRASRKLSPSPLAKREQPVKDGGDLMRVFHPELPVAPDAAAMWGTSATVSELSNGTPRLARDPIVTRLDPEHEAQFLDLLLGLDKASRIARFSYVASDASVIAYGKRALSTAAFVAGVFVDGRLRGVVEVFEGNDGGASEIAFAVHQEWRRRGFCFALLNAATQWAQQSSIATLRLIISRCNWPMRHLAEKAGARFDLSLDEICADIAVPEKQSGLVAA
jgi:RimJ/RimL family protein N-acetyltransferase